jgi:hypothetical protein
MNMFMRNIMNNTQRRSNRPPPQQMQARRRQYGFRNGYNQSNQFQRQSNSNTSPHNLMSVDRHQIRHPISENEIRIPSTLQYQMFNIFININVNNLSSELINNMNPQQYFSEFSYEGLNIRFFHNEILNYQNIGSEIESVLNNINEREFQNILNDFYVDEMNEYIDDTLHNDNSSHMNSREIIKQINKNITHGEYVHYASILKNHTCPILLTDFENEDIVSIFTLCNHAIHESTCEKYTKTFTKCPLCNHKLFE